MAKYFLVREEVPVLAHIWGGLALVIMLRAGAEGTSLVYRGSQGFPMGTLDLQMNFQTLHPTN